LLKPGPLPLQQTIAPIRRFGLRLEIHGRFGKHEDADTFEYLPRPSVRTDEIRCPKIKGPAPHNFLETGFSGSFQAVSPRVICWPR
jgi:hypothetical protein